jgi:hypothetical protein
MFNHQLLPRLELDRKDTKAGRCYITPVGIVPSVTTVIDNLQDKTFLKRWREKIGDLEADRIVQESRKHGNTIHKLCESYLLNQRVWKMDETVNPNDIRPFHNITPILDKNIETVYGVELPVWSATLKTAGTTDAVVKWQKENTILDFKTSRKPIERKSEKFRLYMLQAVIYSILVREQYAIDCPWSTILVIVKNEKPEITRFRNRDYEKIAADIFLRALTTR